MTLLKTLLCGPLKRALMGMGYSGAMYAAAWQTIQRKFGQPHLIVSTQVSKIQNYPISKPYVSESLTILVETVSNFKKVLQSLGTVKVLFRQTI